MTTYDYARGDRLVERNSYHYSAFEGPGFLRAWEAHREEALRDLGPPSDRAQDAQEAATDLLVQRGFETARLLEALFAAIGEEGEGMPESASTVIALLVQRFEVTKRLHRAYGPNLRAVDREAFRDMGLYVRFAEVLEQAHRRTGSLPCLNALLKCLDTLCSVRGALSSDDRARTARLVLAERELVAAVAGRVEVAW